MPPRWKRTVWILLAALLAGLATSALAQPYGSRAMRTGQNGEDVTHLQMRLRDLGYLSGPVDGKFGPLTLRAVAAFQRDYGLAATGTAGRWTVAQMDRAYAWRNSSWYQVAEGERLADVAARFGTRPEVLIWMNRLPAARVEAGQVVRVPDPAAPGRPPAPDSAPGSPAVVPAPGQPGGELIPPPPAPPEPPPPPAHPPEPEQPQLPALEELAPVIMGYYVEYWDGDRRSLASMDAATDSLNMVVSFQYNTDAAGNLTGRDFPELMARARERRMHVFALIHNWDSDLGGFNRTLVREMLATAASREQAASNMVAGLAGKGFTGINLDLENVPPALRQAYTDLVARLATKARQAGLYMTLSVPAKTADNPKDGWSGGFDYAALAPLVDLIAIMSYDEHSPGFAAGPVASLDWVDRVMKYATSQIPPEKILMGVAAYAYDWVVGTGSARGLGVPDAVKLAADQGVKIQWDASAQVPFFRYTDSRGRERVVYFEDARSLRPKLGLVGKYQIRGIAMWRLGLEDPAVWPVIAAELVR